MEIRNLKVGDHFVKWDGKICRLILLNDCRATIQSEGNTRNISPGTEILRRIEKDDTLLSGEQDKTGISNKGGFMKTEGMIEESVAKEFIEKFVETQPGATPSFAWRTLREKKGRFAWPKFKTIFVDAGGKKSLHDMTASERAAEKKVAIVETEKKPAEKKTKKKKTESKKTKTKKPAKTEPKFSKASQIASKPKRSLTEMAKALG